MSQTQPTIASTRARVMAESSRLFRRQGFAAGVSNQLNDEIGVSTCIAMGLCIVAQ
jgi:hypothetical protein